MTDRIRSRDGGNFWLVILIALAIGATVIMLISSSSLWLQVALLAALWAAIIGFLLVGRARNDRDAAQALLAAREREYEAELEALSARNDADRAASGLPPTADLEILREIREELATLRAQLEELSGREFGYEPAALQAEARRVKEIEARADTFARGERGEYGGRGEHGERGGRSEHREQSAHNARAYAQPGSDAAPQRPAHPATGSYRWDGYSSPAPTATPSVGPNSTSFAATPKRVDETTRIDPIRQHDDDDAFSPLPHQTQRVQPGRSSQTTVRPSGAPSTEAVAGRVGSHRAAEGPNPVADLIRERQVEIDREKVERERREREEQERAERERRDQERQRREREARERAARERQAREEQERRAREEQERRAREEQERRERERQAREEQERRAREEQMRRAREAEERREREERARREREAQERAARERREREERARREQARREIEERARREREERERREQVQREIEAREREARDREAREREAREQAQWAEEQRRQAEAEELDDVRRGRRRADGNRSGALSVAELMARNREDQ